MAFNIFVKDQMSIKVTLILMFFIFHPEKENESNHYYKAAVTKLEEEWLVARE
jgi:hypothetical protein